MGFSLWLLLLLLSMGSRAHGLSLFVVPWLWGIGSIVVAYGLSCFVACGIFPEQGSNLCLLDWQVDSLPLSHQGSPAEWSYLMFCLVLCMSADSINTAFFFLTDEETEVQRCRTEKRVWRLTYLIPLSGAKALGNPGALLEYEEALQLSGATQVV